MLRPMDRNPEHTHGACKYDTLPRNVFILGGIYTQLVLVCARCCGRKVGGYAQRMAAYAVRSHPCTKVSANLSRARVRS